MTSPREGFTSAEVDVSRADRLLIYHAPDGRWRGLDEGVQAQIEAATTLEGLAACLALLLSGGYAVWEETGQLLETRALVAALGSLRIIIQPNEHAPPHFHVRGPNHTDASFVIEDCSKLVGQIDSRDEQIVRYWFKHARPRLVEVWNATRPSNCTVGPIRS